MLRILGCFGSGKKRKGKEGRNKEKKKYKERHGRMYRQGRMEGRKEGGGRKVGEGRRGRKGVNRMCSAALKGRGAQDLAVVGLTFSHRVHHHINPSLLPVSPRWY